jgi:hypothetical protein
VFEQVERQEQTPVAVVASQASAELLVATLRVHSVEATTMIASTIPSLDWIEGFAVLVPSEDAEVARALLAELGHEPIEGDPDRPGPGAEPRPDLRGGPR